MITKTSREYQTGYAEFMLSLKEFDIINSTGSKVHKPTFFDAIYKEHQELSGEPFCLKRNVQYLIIKSGHHKDYCLKPRNVETEYSEDIMYCEKSREVFHRRAGAIVHKIKEPQVPMGRMVTILVETIESTFKSHHQIEQEIENAFT
jgi:hypothetical protein